MKTKKLLLLPLLLSSCMVGCDSKESVTISCSGASERVKFALSTLEKNIASSEKYKVADNGTYQIVFHDIDASLGVESYTIALDNKTINITAGDETGLMYGGLDVAEQIEHGKALGSINTLTVKPDTAYRGLKFNAPLDMRTPSYTDGGDSGQSNIATMWEKEFWQKEFDLMALNRYNALSLWNLNPFPSMVKLADYPDVALNDVWKTKLYFDASYNGTASDLVRDEHWVEGSYDIIKNITIDEKINYWKEIMAMAHARGIKFYIYTWNVYTFGEHNKYGINCELDNPITKDYYKKSVQAMIETYPDLDGIGIGAGENMKTSSSGGSANDGGAGVGDEDNEYWLHDTYGEGIKAALAKEPNRDFEVIHRMHMADGKTLDRIWSDLPCKFNVSDKYSIAHMYSVEKPLYTDETIAGMTANQNLWLELRNDDSFFNRWGGIQFARGLITQIPDRSCGFLMGSDGYIQGREYTSKIDEFKGQLYMEKHWYNYMLMGRIGYQNNLTDDFFKEKLQVHFKELDSDTINALFDCMNNAGYIIPNSNILFFNSIDAWYPEGNWTNANTFGYVGIKRLINSKLVHPYANVLSIPEYCIAIENNETINSRTPIDIINNLNNYADQVLAVKDTLLSKKALNREFEQLVLDQIAYANLGKYYANKYEATINLRFYNDLKDDAKKTAAVTFATKASDYWKEYANSMIERYTDEVRLSRAGIYSFSNVSAEVEKDISVCQKWTPRSY